MDYTHGEYEVSEKQERYYTPTTEEVLDAYLLSKGEDYEVAGEGFERWLSEIAAAAWEQGKQAGRWVHMTGPNPHR